MTGEPQLGSGAGVGRVGGDLKQPTNPGYSGVVSEGTILIGGQTSQGWLL